MLSENIKWEAVLQSIVDIWLPVFGAVAVVVLLAVLVRILKKKIILAQLALISCQHDRTRCPSSAKEPGSVFGRSWLRRLSAAILYASFAG